MPRHAFCLHPRCRDADGEPYKPLLLVILCYDYPDDAHGDRNERIDHAAAEETDDADALTAELTEETTDTVNDHICRINILDLTGTALKPENETTDDEVPCSFDGLYGEHSSVQHGVVNIEVTGTGRSEQQTI